MKMPDGFLWGGSVSAHQTEGAGTAEYGKGPSIYDYLKLKGFGDFSQGIDTYHQYAEDAALFGELGLNSYRFSVSWSRVLPEGEGQVNEKGLEFYDHFIDALLANGIQPIICLYHFDTPLALQKKYGGWMSRKTVDAYEQYARLLMERYRDKVKYWIPMNEQNNCPLVGLLSAGIRAEDPNYDKIRNQLIHHMALASASVVKCQKELIPEGTVIGMINAEAFYPKTCHPKDAWTAQRENQRTNFDLLDLLVRGIYGKAARKQMEKKGTFPQMTDGDEELLRNHTIKAMGISYYGSRIVSRDNAQMDMGKDLLTVLRGGQTSFEPNPYLDVTEWGWTVDAMGLRTVLNQLYQRYELPLYVLESGIGVRETLNEKGTVEDDYRIAYFKQQIEAVRSAICEDGVDVRSFLTWAPIDILSSRGEMEKRYGFIYVDRGDQELRSMNRYKKKSFSWFQNVIARNGEQL